MNLIVPELMIATNALLQDKELSPQAKTLYMYIMVAQTMSELEGEWEFSPVWFNNSIHSPLTGENFGMEYRAAFTELVERGILGEGE